MASPDLRRVEKAVGCRRINELMHANYHGGTQSNLSHGNRCQWEFQALLEVRKALTDGKMPY